MNRIIKKEDINNSGELIINENNVHKTYLGKIMYVDHEGSVIFKDTNTYIHKARRTDVVDFTSWIVSMSDVGKFGELVAGESGYEKELHGRVLYVNHLGTIIFVDNDDFSYIFPRELIRSFQEKEFKEPTT